MGKAKRSRQKHHVAAVKCDVAAAQPKDAPSHSSDFFAIPRNISSRQVFDTKSLAGDRAETMSVASFRSSMSNAAREGTKKQRRVDKKKSLIDALSTMKELDAEARAARKRKTTVVVGDMRPLTDALPSIQTLIAQSQENRTRAASKENSKKQKHIHKRQMEDLDTFHSLANNKDFKVDMQKLVAQSVQERLRRDKEETDKQK